MTTTPQNLIKYTETNVWAFPNGEVVGSGNVIHSGDMVYVDTPTVGTSTYNLVALATDAQAAAFAGVTQATYDPTNYGVYNNDPVLPDGYAVQRTGLYYPYTTSGETYFPGTTVYIGANAQTITKGTTAYTHAVGYVANPVSDPNGVNYQAGLVGVGTNQVLIYLRPQWPTTTV